MCKKKQKIPELGDLILVKNHAIESQKERKLKAKWFGPRIFDLYLASKFLAHIQEIYDNRKTKKYHLNNIVLYKKKSTFI